MERRRCGSTKVTCRTSHVLLCGPGERSQIPPLPKSQKGGDEFAMILVQLPSTCNGGEIGIECAAGSGVADGSGLKDAKEPQATERANAISTSKSACTTLPIHDTCHITPIVSGHRAFVVYWLS